MHLIQKKVNASRLKKNANSYKEFKVLHFIKPSIYKQEKVKCLIKKNSLELKHTKILINMHTIKKLYKIGFNAIGLNE